MFEARKTKSVVVAHACHLLASVHSVWLEFPVRTVYLLSFLFLSRRDGLLTAVPPAAACTSAQRQPPACRSNTFLTFYFHLPLLSKTPLPPWCSTAEGHFTTGDMSSSLTTCLRGA